MPFISKIEVDQITSHFNEYLVELNTLCGHIQKQLTSFPASISLDEKNFLNDPQYIIQSIKSLSPDPSLKAQETPSFPGAMACNSETIELINQLNKRKDLLRAQFEQHKRKSSANPTKHIRDILKKEGYGAINLKQAYRHIYYVNYHPERIAWVKSKSLSNVVLSHKEAETMLLKAGVGKNIEIQLNKLKGLSSSEKIIKQRKIKARLQVNVSHRNCEDKFETQCIHTTLPLFYLFDETKLPPVVCFSKPISNKESRAVRSDKKLEEKPFLPSISAYLYQKGLRNNIVK